MSTETIAFSMPTAELVEHALRELEWAERLPGYSMTPSAGNAQTDLYNLPDAIRFTLGTSWDAPLLSPGHKGAINWVDVNRFAAWLRDVIGDLELADAVYGRVVGLDSYQAQMTELAEVMTERMHQYRDVRLAAQQASGDGESPAE